MLENVDFESKFDQLPEFQPGKETKTPIPQSPRVLIAGLRKKKMEVGESPVSTPHRVSGESRYTGFDLHPPRQWFLLWCSPA